MTLQEIKEHYQVQKFNNTYLLYDLNPNSCVRFNHKYLCQLEKNGINFKIVGYDVIIKTIYGLKNTIELYHNVILKHDSMYYNPLFRFGVKEQLIVHDYLTLKLGFKMSGNNYYVLSRKNIYNKVERLIELSIPNLNNDDDKEIFDKIDIKVITGEYSYFTIETKYDADEIISTINTVIKPIMFDNIISGLSMLDKIPNSKINVETMSSTIINPNNFNINTIKVDLKKELQNLIDLL